MDDTTPSSELPLTRKTVGELAAADVEELPRYAHQLHGEARILDSEARIVRALLREKTRRPGRLSLVGEAAL